jgi:hypothetical protein
MSIRSVDAVERSVHKTNRLPVDEAAEPAAQLSLEIREVVQP